MSEQESGARLRRVALGVTALFAATSVGGLILPVARGLAAVVAAAMFIGGSVVMLAAVVIAARRGRGVEIGIGGLFFLSVAAPRRVQQELVGAFALQVVLGFATAAARPYTSAALGVLAPVAGLGLSGLWGARHGRFGEP